MRINGWSPIHESVQRDDADEALILTKQLLSKNCLPNPMDDDWKQTPLYFAANQDRKNVAALLIEYAADMNHRDVYHQPALFYAAKHASMDIARYFIEELGISPSLKDKAGRKAITYAKMSDEKGSHQEIIEYLEEREALRKGSKSKAGPKKKGNPWSRAGSGRTRSSY